MLRRVLSLVPVLLAALLSAPHPAFADRLPWVGLWQEGRPHDGDPNDVTLSSAAEAAPMVRGLPFGFNRGTCDRDRIGSEERVANTPTDTGMDKADLGCLAAALAWLPDGTAVAWAGDDGARHRVTTQQSWLSGGRPCRAYRAVSQANGRILQLAGSACRQADGRWALSE
jgi:hypothetical protein